MIRSLLFTSAGRRNQLLQCFRDDASALGLPLRLLAADLKPDLSSACHQADMAYAVPRCTDSDYVPALMEICQRHEVSLLVPTIDTELALLSRHVSEFAAVGTRVVVSEPTVVDLARDKIKTALRLADAGVSIPQTLQLGAYLADPSQLKGAVIAKPKGGSSSIGIIRPKSPSELEGLSQTDYLVQEMWEGIEYTVNVFFDHNGELRCAVPHRRIETRGGEVSKGRTERVPVLVEAARKLATALPGARGPLCFQAIVTEAGEYAVFEINARFGGGYPLAHRAGAQFSKWLLEEAAGLSSSANDDWKDGVTMLRYDAAVFLNE